MALALRAYRESGIDCTTDCIVNGVVLALAWLGGATVSKNLMKLLRSIQMLSSRPGNSFGLRYLLTL